MARPRKDQSTLRYHVELGQPGTMGSPYSTVKKFGDPMQAVSAAAKWLHKSDTHLSRFDPEAKDLVNKAIDEMRAVSFVDWDNSSAIQRMGWTIDLTVTRLRVELWKV
jgi:hypothetical protein